MGDVARGGVEILYEDNHILCAVKPRGVLSQSDGSGAPDMLTLLKAYIGEKYEKKGEVYLGLVHRLDRPVGGVMVFAKTSKAAGRLSAQIRERSVQKIYYAVIRGAPQASSARLEHRIKKDRTVNSVRVYEAGGADMRDKEYAALDYRVLALNADGASALVGVELLTGRPHQIRAQFAHIGHPVVGDRKYGSRALRERAADSPALWAASLKFAHPVRQTPVIVAARPPDEYPWNEFEGKTYTEFERI